MRAYYTGEGAQPNCAHEGDAGFDLAYHGQEPIDIAPDETANIPTGIKVQLPYGTWAMVTGRSSTFKRGLITPLSVIDNGYRGDLFAIVRNLSDKIVTIRPNERVAQLIIIPLLADVVTWEKMPYLDDSERGENGFGSTGL